MSYCEVSLVFNNSDQHIFPTMPFEEVVITRKLDRSGLSEYYINHNRVRMRDIISLFHDTGIGKEGYSIIGQGRVAEIMSAKPGDRRQIFEEAAGISKFRAQRTEAERKLEKTALNLETANQVIDEIQKQINPLKKQAETAEKYFALKEDLKKNEVNLYIYNYENNQSIKQKIYERLAASEKDLKVKEMQLAECIRKYDDLRRESDGIDRVYEDSHNELVVLKVDAATNRRCGGSFARENQEYSRRNQSFEQRASIHRQSTHRFRSTHSKDGREKGSGVRSVSSNQSRIGGVATKIRVSFKIFGRCRNRPRSAKYRLRQSNRRLGRAQIQSFGIYR